MKMFLARILAFWLLLVAFSFSSFFSKPFLQTNKLHPALRIPQIITSGTFDACFRKSQIEELNALDHQALEFWLVLLSCLGIIWNIKDASARDQISLGLLHRYLAISMH